MVSVKTLGRKIEFVDNCIAKSTAYFLLIPSISFLHHLLKSFFSNNNSLARKKFFTISNFESKVRKNWKRTPESHFDSTFQNDLYDPKINDVTNFEWYLESYWLDKLLLVKMFLGRVSFESGRIGLVGEKFWKLFFSVFSAFFDVELKVPLLNLAEKSVFISHFAQSQFLRLSKTLSKFFKFGSYKL